MNKTRWLGWIGFVSLAFCTSVSAVPELIEFNGTLAWSGTNAPLAGVHPFTVRLYDQLTEGTLLWEEQANVEVDASGRYGVQLGAGIRGATTNTLSGALNLAGNSAFLELEVSIDGQTRLFAPRQQLASVPFAMMAGTAHRATKGLAVEGMLIVDGHTTAGERLVAGAAECSEVVVTRQLTIFPGAIHCTALIAPTTNKPIVFSTGVKTTQDVRVNGGLRAFSMRKPNVTKASSSSNSYRSDTDCWLYMVTDGATVSVTVDGYEYTVSQNDFYPIPIPQGVEFRVGAGLELDTDPNNQNVIKNGTSYPNSFYMSLGVAP